MKRCTRVYETMILIKHWNKAHCVLDTVLNVLYIITHNNIWGRWCYSYILGIRTPRPRKDKWIVQDHTDSERLSRDSHPSNLALESVLFPLCHAPVLESSLPFILLLFLSQSLFMKECLLCQISLPICVRCHVWTYPDLYDPGCILGPQLLAWFSVDFHINSCLLTHSALWKTRAVPLHGLCHTFPGKSHSCSSAKVWADWIHKGLGSFHHLGLRCRAVW